MAAPWRAMAAPVVASVFGFRAAGAVILVHPAPVPHTTLTKSTAPPLPPALAGSRARAGASGGHEAPAGSRPRLDSRSTGPDSRSTGAGFKIHAAGIHIQRAGIKIHIAGFKIDAAGFKIHGAGLSRSTRPARSTGTD